MDPDAFERLFPASRHPNWPVFVLRRGADRPDGRDLIVEPWEASPPFGWTAGLRDPETGETDYIGSAGHYAEDAVALYLPNGRTMVEVEGIEDDRPVVLGVFDFAWGLPLPYTEGWDPMFEDDEEEDR